MRKRLFVFAVTLSLLLSGGMVGRGMEKEGIERKNLNNFDIGDHVTISAFTVHPTEIEVGETVTISATIINHELFVDLVLSIYDNDGNFLHTIRRYELDPYEQRSIEENHTFQDIGSFIITIGGEEKTVSVEEDIDEDGSFLSRYCCIPLLLVTSITLIILVIVILKKKKEPQDDHHHPVQQHIRSRQRAEKPPPPFKNIKNCPDCGQRIRFIDEYDSWYCDTCQEYK